MIIFIDLSIIYLLVLIKYLLPLFRDAPEATGDEPEDADFETPKVYELVRTHQCSYQRFFTAIKFVLAAIFLSRRVQILFDLDTTSFRRYCQLT